MPNELREQLVDAARRAGRSLNGEIVHRLEQRVAQEQAPRKSRLSPGRVIRAGLSRPTEGSGMRRKRVRLALSVFAVLVLSVAAALVGGRMTSGTSAQAGCAGG